MEWRFAIHNQPSEPYDEAAVRKLIDVKLVTAETLAWHAGLSGWKPAREIPELAVLLGLAAAAPAASAAPPLPTSGGNAESWEERARRFVYWCFRPRNGRPSKVRAYVDAKPGRAVPVAIAIVAALVVSFALFFNSFQQATGPANGGGGSGGAAMAGGGGNTMENWAIARDAQRYNQNVIDDVYRNNRDSFDRQSETYRRANYDWYNNNND
ncbi:MAG TPA: DUF4339 domain-containing protein [Kiritimatiellia bacterium]|nr:DUF4339 domain-containing protein [Kiritimatiellia bacterium]